VSERSGVRPAEALLEDVSGATGIGGDHTHGSVTVYVDSTKIERIQLDLDLSFTALDGA